MFIFFQISSISLVRVGIQLRSIEPDSLSLSESFVSISQSNINISGQQGRIRHRAEPADYKNNSLPALSRDQDWLHHT